MQLTQLGRQLRLHSLHFKSGLHSRKHFRSGSIEITLQLPIVLLKTVLWGAVQCNEVQKITMQCSSVKRSTERWQCSAAKWQYKAVKWALHCNEVEWQCCRVKWQRSAVNSRCSKVAVQCIGSKINK